MQAALLRVFLAIVLLYAQTSQALTPTQNVVLFGGYPSWVASMVQKAGGAIPSLACKLTVRQCWAPGKGTVSPLAVLSNTRNLSANCTDTNGNLIAVPTLTPCITNAGMDSWESRTNSIPTSDMTGAVAIDNALVNGFFNSPSGVCSGWTVVSFGSGVNCSTVGQVTLQGDNSNQSYVEQAVTVIANQTYEINLTVASSSIGVLIGATQGGSGIVNQTVSAGSGIIRFTPGTGITTAWVRLTKLSSVAVTVSAVSIQAELVTNGDFASNPINASQNTVQNGWQWSRSGGTITPTYTGSAVTLTPDGVNSMRIGTAALTTVVGVTYTITLDVSVGGGSVIAGTTALGSNLLNVGTSVGTGAKYQFTATTTTSFISFVSLTTSSATIDNVSVQSAGKLPNNWVATSPAGLVYTVVGVATDQGFPVVQYRVSGTTTGSASNSVFIRFAGNSSIAASIGQTWAMSFYHRLAGGALSNISLSYAMSGLTSGGAFVEWIINAVAFTPGTSLARASTIANPTNTTDAFIVPQLWLTVGNGVAVDVTLELAAPQDELNPSTQALTAPTTAGAVNGVLSSGGVLPNAGGFQWAADPSALGATLTIANAGGTDSGQNIVDLQIQSAALASGATNEWDVYPQSASNAVAVSSGEQIVGTVYYKTQAATTDNFTTIILEIVWLNSSNLEVGSRATTTISTGPGVSRPATLTQFSVSGIANGTGVAKALLRVRHSWIGTPAINYTPRFGPWSLTPNRGMATPWISTSSGAVTRPADNITVNAAFVPTFGSAVSGYIGWTPQAASNYSTAQFAMVLDRLASSGADTIRLGRVGINALSANQLLADLFNNSSGALTYRGGVAVTAGTAAKTSFAWQSNSQGSSANGATPTTNTSALAPPAFDTIFVGVPWFNSQNANGQITEFAIWPTQRIPNANLQLLSTPYLLNRDLCAANDNACPAANDNSPAFLERVG